MRPYGNQNIQSLFEVLGFFLSFGKLKKIRLNESFLYSNIFIKSYARLSWTEEEKAMDIMVLTLFVFAGIMNGSFATLVKYMRGWEFENIWFQWSLWTFIIIPWLLILITAPQVFEIYAAAPAGYILIIAVGGIAFGIGQACFAYALHSIGIGLSFILTIGISTVLGALLPLIFQHPEEIPTPFGIVTIIGILIAIIGIILCTKAGNLRDKAQKGIVEEVHTHAKKGYWAGIIFASICGITQAGQNFSFSETEGLQTIALEHGAISLGAANIIWPWFLFMSFIPYAAYMLYLFKKDHTFGNYALPGTRRYLLFGPIMGLCWFGSFVIYSKASQIVGELGPVVGWPVFMIFIILISNFWGYIFKEWKGVSRRAVSIILSGIALLVVAVVFLAFAGSLQ